MFSLAYKDKVYFPECNYKTAKGAKVAATKLGFDTICQVSPYSYSCYNFQKKVDGKWSSVKEE